MAAKANRWELKPESLRAVCNPDSLGFETTLELTPLKERVVAQDRAVHALEFGLGVKDLEYNIFVAGPPRAGKTETIMGYLAELAAKDPSPPIISTSIISATRKSPSASICLRAWAGSSRPTWRNSSPPCGCRSPKCSKARITPTAGKP